tara:strand:- start:94 stop:201 length:108 start_codon:yes stop_codon:yes gene_type:complete
MAKTEKQIMDEQVWAFIGQGEDALTGVWLCGGVTQ